MAKIYSVLNMKEAKISQLVEGIVTFEGNDIEVSDGYHTMDELYDHRMALSAALFALIKDCPYDNIVVYKSKLHHDGTMFEGGYFVVGFVAENLGQISYHYKLEHWDKFRIDEYERAPDVYDGHTSKDVIERLLKL